MKIIFLNAWGGKLQTDITKFIAEQSRDTDIFCFQEAGENMKDICKSILTDYDKVVAEKSMTNQGHLFQATYVNKKIRILSSGVLLATLPGSGLGIYTHVRYGQSEVHVCNIHGIALPPNKLDNPDRLEQSRGVIDFLKDKPGPKIIGGDFNLFPETESVKMFEQNGYKNLIKDFEIKTTRNQVAWDRWPGNKQDYADYVFINSEVEIKSFSVPDVPASDHLPLILIAEFRP